MTNNQGNLSQAQEIVRLFERNRTTVRDMEEIFALVKDYLIVVDGSNHGRKHWDGTQRKWVRQSSNSSTESSAP